MSWLTGQPSTPTASGDPQQDAINQAMYDQQMAQFRSRQQGIASNEAQRVERSRGLSDYMRDNQINQAGSKTAFGPTGSPLSAEGLSEQDFIELIARMKGNSV